MEMCNSTSCRWVVGCRVVVRCCHGVCCLCLACGPSLRAGRRIESRLVVSVVGSSRRGRNADRNSLLRLLVVSAERRLLPLSSSLGHGQCGLDVDVDNGAVLTRLIRALHDLI